MKRILSILILVFVENCVSSQEYDFVVAKDGSGNFLTVQDAINAVPDFRKNRTMIFIKTGIYKEKLILPGSKINVTFIGEERDSTILTFDDSASKRNRFGEEIGTTGSTSFFVFGEGFEAENITFENSSGPVGQAVAVRINGDMVTFKNCRFLGFQDTLYPHGTDSRQYYSNCYIEGTVDFIFGWSTAVFDHCTIHCKARGYITAPSTEKNNSYGFVFLDCKVSGTAPDSSVYLGRPWRSYGKSVFINCELSRIIKPEGWNNWGNPGNEKTAFFAEYKNTGNGSDIKNRVGWSYQLTDKQVKDYTPEKILGDWVIPRLFNKEINNKTK
jgi:pectinesterase